MRKLLKSVVRRHRKRKNLRLGLKSRDPFVVIKMLSPSRPQMIFDVGAHVGLAAARFRELFPGVKIHCFEPFPESFEKLEAAASVLQPIELHRFALADTDGELQFSVNSNSATNSLLASDERAEVYWRGDTPRTLGSLTVKARTLDAFARDNAIEAIDVLKMDVQGGEYDVLQGAREMLSRQAIGLIYMELITAPTYLGQHRIREYLELFDANGYELFELYNFGRSHGRLLQTDIIVVNAETLGRYEQGLAGAK